MNISIKGSLDEELSKFNQDLPKVLNYITAEVAKKFSDYTRRNYLLGQSLQKRSGETYRSVKFYKKENMEMGVSPGVKVPGSLNYLNKWIGTDRDFMRKSYKSFVQSGRADKTAEYIINQLLRKKGFE